MPGQRKHVVFAGLICGVAALILVTQTWILVNPPNTGVKVDGVKVSGGEGAPAAVALAVVAVAGTLALTIAGTVARWIIAVVQGLAGLGLAGFSVSVLANPSAAAAGKVGESFGVGAVDSKYALTVFPWLSVAVGVLIVLVAVWTALVKLPRRDKTHRYDRKARDVAVEDMDQVDQWDALTHGEDPTDPSTQSARNSRFH